MPLHYSAPGKLFISGEWAILEVGNYGMVAAVDNRVHVSIDSLAGYDGISVTAEEFKIVDARAKYVGGKLNFMNIDEKAKETLKLLSNALSVALRYLEEHNLKFKPFKITTSSKEAQVEVDGQLKKVGFGSSAAVVVASVAAVLDFFGYRATKDEIYKLSTIAHYFAQGKVGSAFDVAASTYGGLFVYSRFDPDWLTKSVESEKLSTVVREKWPSLVVEELKVPEDFRLLVAWTKESASTTNMIKQMNEFKASNPEEYRHLFGEIATTAKHVIHFFKAGDREKYINALRKNRQLLKELTDVTNLPIETNDLRVLAEIAEMCGAAGKLSGAGGGDCGIAVCFSDSVATEIVEKWQKSGMYPLNVTIDRDGVRREK